MKMFATVQGLKRSKGMLENGKTYDSTTVYVNFPFGQSEDMRGSATQPMKYGDYSNYQKFDGVALPFEAEIEIEAQTNGNKVTNVITSITPIGVAKGSDKPKV